MLPELGRRQPGGGLPRAVRDAAVQAGRQRRPVDLEVLARVREALLRLPGSARGQYYYTIPGQCLASPRPHQETL
jgi:hypothetical protein